MSDKPEIPKDKDKADGRCGICNERVPESFGNKFYCSIRCCSKAFNYFHPENEEDYE